MPGCQETDDDMGCLLWRGQVYGLGQRWEGGDSFAAYNFVSSEFWTI